MSEFNIIRSAVDHLTGEVIYEFDVPFKAGKKPFWKFWGKQKEDQVRTFKIYSPYYGTQMKVAALALSLPREFFTQESRLFEFAPEHMPTLIKILGWYIVNGPEGPNDELLDFLKWNLTNKRGEKIFTACLIKTELKSFMNSMVLMTGVAEQLEVTTSPMEGSELIASHKPEFQPF